MPLSHRTLTIATPFCLPCQRRSWTICSMFKMLQHIQSQGPGNVWSVTANARRPALAGYSSASAVQACCDSPSCCLRHQAPRYLVDYCVPVSKLPGRQHLRSARSDQLSVPRVSCSTFGTRVFSVAGPQCWVVTNYM